MTTRRRRSTSLQIKTSITRHRHTNTTNSDRQYELEQRLSVTVGFAPEHVKPIRKRTLQKRKPILVCLVFFSPPLRYNISKLSARIPTTGRHEAQVDVSAHFLPRCNLVHNLNSAPIFRHSRCALCRVPLHTPRGSKQIPIHVLITCSHGHANLAGESVAGPSKESACKSVSRSPPRVTLLLLFCSTGAFFPSPAFLRRRGQSISPDPFPDEVPAHIPKCRLSPPLSLSLPKQSENRNNTQKASGRRQSVLRKKKKKKRNIRIFRFPRSGREETTK